MVGFANGTSQIGRNRPEQGQARQQVSVTRTGKGADNNPAASQVLGDLSQQLGLVSARLQM